MSRRRFSYVLAFTLLAALSVPAYLSAQSQPDRHGQTQYYVISLGVPLGGSASSTAAINDLGWIAGSSNLAGDQTEHAELWIYGHAIDLGTLGGPNSAVLWPGLNDFGQTVGISDTDRTDPYGEPWSCGNFLPASHLGHTCVGFLWQNGNMTALPTLGGNNGFATGINNRGQAVGWAENTVHDPTCNTQLPQILQFEAVIWGPRPGQIQQLPPYANDPDGAATDINDSSQVVGISGICENAVGALTAKHALLWQNGRPISLGNLGGVAWNTPMAINNRGQVVGFSDLQGDDNGNNPNFHAFYWSNPGPMQDLGTISGDAISEALGVNQSTQIVGVSYAAGFANPRAFLYENGRMIDLNQLAPNSPLYLQVAQEINDEGVIVGAGCVPGNCSATSPSIAFVAIPYYDQHDLETFSAGHYVQPQPASSPSKALLQHLGIAGIPAMNASAK